MEGVKVSEFKVGDRVRIKTGLVAGEKYGRLIWFKGCMSEQSGKSGKVINFSGPDYIVEGCGGFIFSSEMLEPASNGIASDSAIRLIRAVKSKRGHEHITTVVILPDGRKGIVHKHYKDADNPDIALLEAVKKAIGRKDPEKKQEKCEFKVGDKVRLNIPKGEKPSRGWGSASNGDIGTIRELNGNGIVISFPKQDFWMGIKSEIEHV
jgi:ribosomal protein L21E